MGPAERRWRALWEAGVGHATLDGISALVAAGVTMLSEDTVHVSVPHGVRLSRIRGVRVHRVPRRIDGETVGAGIRRATPAVAAVRAAHWAVSDRQAALILCLVVQQRVVSASALRRTAKDVSGRRRRALVRRLVADVTDGAHSLGELDLGAQCRRRGLPPPDRQVVRQGARGWVYLDLRIDLVGLRIAPDAFLDQVETALVARGSRRRASTASRSG